MGNAPRSRAGRAKLGLGLSLVFAVVAFAYFALSGSPVSGAGLAVLVVAAGYWEYRRKLQDETTAERYEAKAEEHRQRDRK